MGRLDDRTIITTGGAAGIGRAYATGFVQEGASVVIADIDGAGAERVARELEAEGGRSLAVTVDVSDVQATEAMTKATLDRFGRVDGGSAPREPWNRAAPFPTANVRLLLRPARGWGDERSDDLRGVQLLRGQRLRAGPGMYDRRARLRVGDGALLFL